MEKILSEDLRPNKPFRDFLRPGIKRSLDITISALLLILLMPALVLVALIIIRDGGPALFSHERVGRRGRKFKCFKFRTMHPNSDTILNSLLLTDELVRTEWESSRKLRSDPRVTSVGRLLRSTSLDELPQLFNVLLGDMSLVGPRPIVQEELDVFYLQAGGKDAYLSVRPGITGSWQVSGRSNITYMERIALDTAYARTPSLRSDLAILARTIVVVMRRSGAY
jgi:undecaprenyl-phosphate galactose phosphotransferase